MAFAVQPLMSERAEDLEKSFGAAIRPPYMTRAEDALAAREAEAAGELPTHTCEHCGEGFYSEKAVANHMRNCSMAQRVRKRPASASVMGTARPAGAQTSLAALKKSLANRCTGATMCAGERLNSKTTGCGNNCNPQIERYALIQEQATSSKSFITFTNF